MGAVNAHIISERCCRRFVILANETVDLQYRYDCVVPPVAGMGRGDLHYHISKVVLSLGQSGGTMLPWLFSWRNSFLLLIRVPFTARSCRWQVL
jgi:hypothetical protein